MTLEEEKKRAAEKAVDYIKSGMIVGLGTGSTVKYALEKIAKLIEEGKLKDIIGIPTSKHTEERAIELGIPISTLNKYPVIDITIDGADEVDEEMNLIKGGGGALLREKIIAQASKKLIIVIDPNKRSKKLGEKFFVPVEVLQFAEEVEKKFLESLGAFVTKRLDYDGGHFITDEKNVILDCQFGVLENPAKIASILNDRAGIVEHGIFINLANEVVTGQ